ncbi:MAG: acylphosphatase [Phycisphaerales bacterium]|nr:acylphosphatase [Planctomycetota bacterium]MCH8508624.1 acylphosphatase [Phycisphaerales bacterium]
MVRRRVVFQGRVQGVGFRARARDTARTHPVTGWVRNEPDGTVRLEVQGEPDAVARYLSDLRRRVSGLVEREFAVEVGLEGGERGFEIVH